MSRIALIGAHGQVAQQVVAGLVEAGHQVTGVVRQHAHEPAVMALGARAELADVQDLGTDALITLLRGHDAVVWSAGAGGGSPERTYAVDRDAAIRTIDAAQAAGVPRFVMVSYFGSSTEHGVAPDDPFYAYAEAKAAADEHLRASALGWTVLGPSLLTDEPGTGLIDTGATEATQVPRADVAETVVAVLADESTVGRTIAFNAGQTPIKAAITG